MKTLEKLKLLQKYYITTRGSGHTTLMKEGVDNTEEKLILCNKLEEHSSINCKPSEIVPWTNVARLIGQSKPLAIDNGAMLELLNNTIFELEELEDQKLELQQKINHIKKILK